MVNSKITGCKYKIYSYTICHVVNFVFTVYTHHVYAKVTILQVHIQKAMSDV